MKYNISGKNIELTAALENAVEEKIVKLDKYFNDSVMAQITLSVEKLSHIIEITIPFNGSVLRAEVEGKNMYNIMDDAVAVIEKQINKYKNRLRDKHRNTVSEFTPSFLEEDENDGVTLKIEKTKKFAIKPMSAEEAVLQMELVGHNFFVYLDGETEEVNVVYKRKNGTYGLIEPVLE
ncbi:ribosome hibernation-promoting factor, HPF/YfiA family [Cellulosilyticum lentocellum]|uniref:Ribosome hibernation promoting factor n=1 Tax=Cellulosilyticum lentocellum (strain ATCC 49066 / DSM 5427 / NCIMB 11756 / RHM5) TaxID=642492 RepID=F2JRR7_CELLD|nr:ribosome-associated translation inhibitor RaiA [Cellulosilyticum lentocellum]ADZ85097.1 sigma 54 modulation protein/ribosomal protein S30EA [Cellulosilyticum lentocellum DSM 5427]